MALVNYDFDLKRMVSMLLGSKHRRTKRIAWLTALLKPLRNLHTEFVTYFNSAKYDIKWNGQTIKLEKLLIEKFGAGITVVNNSNTPDGMSFGAGNDLASSWGAGQDVGGYWDISYNINAYNFTVNVPNVIVFTMSEMEAYINKYKRYGTTYNIVIV